MKRGPRKKVCRKVCYPNAATARAALKVFGKARGSKRFYRCPYHGKHEVWHLTSEPRR